MESRKIDCDLDGVAGSCGRTRRNARGERLLLVSREVQEDFITHKLGDVDVAGDYAVSHAGQIHRLVVDALGAQTDNDFLADIVLEVGVVCLFVRELQGVAGEVDVYVLALLLKLSVDEVHLRRADEACDEQVARIVVQVLRRVDLLDKTVLHDDDSRSHRHSLDLVVGNVNERRAESLVDLGKLGSHRRTELRVEVRQRLVKKEYLRVADDSASERDTLLLTTGQSLRLSVKQVGDVEDTSGLFDLSLDLLLRGLAELQTERHVVKHRHMRIQSVVLEHHRDIAVLRSYVVYELVADEELALGDFLKSRDHTKGGGFTATGRSDENDELLVLDFKAEVRYGGNAAGIFLIDMLQR